MSLKPRIPIWFPILGALATIGVLFWNGQSEMNDVLTDLTIRRKEPDSELLKKVFTSPVPADIEDEEIQRKIIEEAIANIHRHTAVITRKLSPDGSWRYFAGNLEAIKNVVIENTVKEALERIDREASEGNETLAIKGYTFESQGTYYHVIMKSFPLAKNERVPTGQIVLITNLDASVNAPDAIIRGLLINMFLAFLAWKILFFAINIQPIVSINRQLKRDEIIEIGWWVPPSIDQLARLLNDKRTAEEAFRKESEIYTAALTVEKDKAQGYADQIEENQRIWRHDLLSTAKGVYDMFELLDIMGFTVEDEGYAETYEMARKAAKSCYTLIKETRKLGNSKDSLTIAPFSVKEVFSNLAAKYTQYNVVIGSLKDDDFVLIDSGEFTDRALCNLINNAIRYSNPPHEKVEVLYRAKGSRGYFLVKDNGPGLSPEDINKVMGGMGEAIRLNPEIEGSGLGLYSVRRIAAAHGGELTVKSKVGEGSVFILSVARQQ
jgi:signal transduction histidine kinase